MSEQRQQIEFWLVIHFQNFILTAQRADGAVIWQSVSAYGGAWNFVSRVLFYFRFKYDLLVGQRTVERSIIEIGSALPLDEECTMVVRGRNLKNGLPEALEVSSAELYAILKGPAYGLAHEVNTRLKPDPNFEWSLERNKHVRGDFVQHMLIPKPLRPVLQHSHVTLTGGVISRLTKLDQLLTEEVGVPFVVSDSVPDVNDPPTFFDPALLE